MPSNPSQSTANADSKPPIYLLDAMSFIFRAYHAMQRQRPMSTRAGVPTAATYVFVNMINKLRRDFAPEYFAAVFDPAGPVFRDERAREMVVRKFSAATQAYEQIEYGGYKAQREAMPADLAQQIPYIRRALDAFRIPILMAEGFEADDVLGTLAAKAAREGHDVFIVSNDKDMMQLVHDGVKILNPVKDNLILDRDKVTETLGVPPEQVVDVMALRGDSIDNVPGAPGIGDKGSVDIIRQFGSVEAALDRAQEIARKTYRESLQNNREAVLLSKELVTIHCEVPVEFAPDAMRTRPPDLAACRTLFTELEFTTLLRELGPADTPSSAEYFPSPSPEQSAAFLAQARTSGFALALSASDLAAASEQVSEQESEALEEKEPELRTMSLLDLADAACAPAPAAAERGCVLGVAASPDTALVLPLDELRGLLEDAAVPKQVHDVKAALRILGSHGVTLQGATDDVMLYSYLINPTHATHRLADVAARFGPQPLRESGDAQAAEAAHAIHTLAPAMRHEIDAIGEQRVYQEIDLPLAPVLLRMEQTGIRIDSGVLLRMADRLAADIAHTGEEIYSLSGHRFNIQSPKQLGDVLFNKMGLPRPLKYGKGKVISTAQDVLEELAEHHPVPRLVLEYRQLAKLKSNYADSLPLLADQDGRVHTTFNQVGTATGRLSSTNPNLQNIPIRTELGREIRAAFVPAPGCVLLSADYSQIELRLLAHFSADPLLMRAYQTGEDIHTLTASEVFGVPAESMDKETRNRAKAVNFGIVYGISPFGLAAQLGIEQAESRIYIEKYFARYHGVRGYIDRMLEETRREQKVRTLFGRIRPIPDIQSRNANQRGFAERTAINSPLQGTAADLIKLAMIRIDRRLAEEKLAARMTLQVHDELVFDVPHAELEPVRALVRHEMEHVIELSVPLVAGVGVGPNWRDLE